MFICHREGQIKTIPSQHIQFLCTTSFCAKAHSLVLFALMGGGIKTANQPSDWIME